MKPVTELTADELLAEADQMNRMLLGASTDEFTSEAYERRDDLNDAIRQRLQEYDKAREDARVAAVSSFAGSAAYAVSSLWVAHGGSPLADDKTQAFAKLLYEFFLKMHDGEPKTSCEIPPKHETPQTDP